jgi:hypothetical protein
MQDDEELPRVNERKTVDLCSQQHGGGVRCVRERGHDGKHECPMWQHVEPLRWD